MTDRIRTLTVILERDTRDDDVDSLVEAIKHMRGVGTVALGEPVSVDSWISHEELRRRFGNIMLSLLGDNDSDFLQHCERGLKHDRR